MADKNLYLMIVDGKRKWLSLQDAGVAYDSGWVSVSIGGFVLEPDGNGEERPITDQECQQIVNIADEHSDSK